MTAEEIALLAQSMAGSLTEEQIALLPTLCQAAASGLRRYLRPDADGYDEALRYAAACLALSQLRAASGEPERFVAGDFSVTRSGGAALERTAMMLLKPWMAEGFAFRGV